jgi:predicted RecA/RadA family phage recombinase
MSKISLAPDASGTGIFTIASPNSNTNRTLTLPDNTGTIITSGSTTGIDASALSTGTLAAARLPAGSVLQVVTGTTSAAVTSSSQTFIDVGLSASITPTSISSKILIITDIMGVSKTDTDAGNRVDLKLFRGATELDNSGANLFTSGTSLNLRVTFSHSFFDAPATTSSTTYKWQFRNAAISAAVSVQKDGNSGQSQIILMEIAV